MYKGMTQEDREVSALENFSITARNNNRIWRSFASTRSIQCALLVFEFLVEQVEMLSTILSGD